MKTEDIYDNNGVFIGTRRVTSKKYTSPIFDTCAILDYEKAEYDAAYGYDHESYAPDIGDKG